MTDAAGGLKCHANWISCQNVNFRLFASDKEIPAASQPFFIFQKLTKSLAPVENGLCAKPSSRAGCGLQSQMARLYEKPLTLDIGCCCTVVVLHFLL